MNHHKELCADPCLYDEEERRTWAEIWYFHNRVAFRPEDPTAAPMLPDITLEGLDAAICRFKADTAVGTYQLPPRRLWQLSTEGKQAVIDLFHKCEENMC